MKCDVLDLRPTQFVVGMREVLSKLKKIEDASNGELKDYIEEHTVPCVLGPHGHYYMIDHHHFVAACYHGDVEKVAIEKVDEKSKCGIDEFWDYMRQKHWVYLYDQFGNGPHDPRFLPFDVRCMADDIYRSLAWELRMAGVIAKVQKPFSEFVWAKTLRDELHADLHQETYEQIVKRAIDFAKKKIAKGKA